MEVIRATDGRVQHTLTAKQGALTYCVLAAVEMPEQAVREAVLSALASGDIREPKVGGIATLELVAGTGADRDPYYEARPAPFLSDPTLFLFSVVLIPAGVGVILLLYLYVRARFTKVSVDRGSVHYETGVFSKYRIQLRAADIRSVSIKQTFVERLLGVGTVDVFSAGDKAEVSVSGIGEPCTLRDAIDQHRGVSDK